MNISIPLIKAMSVVSILILVSYLTLNFFSSNKNLYESKVMEIEEQELINILREILVDTYYERNQEEIKIVNLGNKELRLTIIPANFSITLSREKLEWEINFIVICLNNPCFAHDNDLYSLDKKVVKEKTSSLIPTLNILVNVTVINGIKIYNFFLKHLTTYSSLLLKNQNNIKIETKKIHEKIIRTTLDNITISFAINKKEIYTYPIENNSLVILNLTKIILILENIKV